jgi:hypothetical protein
VQHVIEISERRPAEFSVPLDQLVDGGLEIKLSCRSKSSPRSRIFLSFFAGAYATSTPSSYARRPEMLARS